MKRTVHRDHDYYRFIFETDAADDCIGRVDAPGVKCLDRAAAEGATANADHLIDGWYLSEGVAEMRLRLPAGVQDKDVLRFMFTVMDADPEPGSFVNTVEFDSPSAETPKPRLPKVNAPQVVPVYEAD